MGFHETLTIKHYYIIQLNSLPVEVLRGAITTTKSVFFSELTL